MKKSVFTFLVSIGAICCAYATTNAASDSSSAAAAAEREIRIKETSAPSGLLRSAPAPVVSAWLSGAQIDLTFLQDLGTVSITVTGAQGVVYQTSVAAADGVELAIDAQGWTAGDYIIEIVRSNGKTYEGEFEL